jgi:hypothetical protein
VLDGSRGGRGGSKMEMASPAEAPQLCWPAVRMKPHER